MMVRFLREYRGVYVVATVMALAVQLPLTIVEIPRIGTDRYVREIRQGIRSAFRCAWGC
jgi:hypothetical protein